MLRQSHLMAFADAVTNTAVGYALAVAVQLAVFPGSGCPPALTTHSPLPPCSLPILTYIKLYLGRSANVVSRGNGQRMEAAKPR